MSFARVFVYGTLKKGHRNHSFLKGARFIGPAQTAPFCLMQAFESVSSPGKFTPGVFQVGSAAIAGEVYEVDETILAMLDKLEGVGEKYDCKTVQLENGMMAFMYFERPGQRIPLASCPQLHFDSEKNVFNWLP